GGGGQGAQEGDALGAAAPDDRAPAAGEQAGEAVVPGGQLGTVAALERACHGGHLGDLVDRLPGALPGGLVGARRQQDVLVAVVEAGVEHGEAGALEQPHQRADGEVGAVLVVDVQKATSSSTRRVSGSSKQTVVALRPER